jgi:23S rRNA pseudouridine2605 synthase
MSSPPEDDLPMLVTDHPAADAEPDGAAGASEEGGLGAPTEGEAGGEARRGRRRNRRNRRKGEGEAGAAGEAGSGQEPPKADAVFEEVLSGAFDVDGEAEASAEPEPEEAAHKRVLAAEPDAPKLHKVLAQAGIGSRREMEQMILEGRITVNGDPAHIGQRISFGDQVKVGGKPIRFRIVPPPPRVVAYHKPVGEIVTHDDPQNRPTVFRRLPRLSQGKWQSVGRLDINTEGLLLFTNSGSLANQLMHPRFGVEREYAVRVLGSLSEEAREKLLAGIEIDGQACAFKSIDEGGGDGANRWYRVVITEGRNREVRRLFEAVGLAVSRLIRIRYGTVVLPHGLKRGMWVDLGEGDVRAIRRLAGGAGGNEGPRHPPADEVREPREGGNGKRRRRGRGGRDDDDRPPRELPGAGEGIAAEPRERAHDDDDLDDHGPIPNPLEQTFDKRFVQKPRSSIGGRGFKQGGGGFGPGGSAPAGGSRKANPGGPRQPDPMQTSVGYIGADAFHRKNRGGGRGGRGGSGGGGGFGGGFGGGGGGRGR